VRLNLLKRFVKIRRHPVDAILGAARFIVLSAQIHDTLSGVSGLHSDRSVTGCHPCPAPPNSRPTCLRIVAIFLGGKPDQSPNRPNRLRRGQVSDAAMEMQAKLAGPDIV
jgi:hypothetical protein